MQNSEVFAPLRAPVGYQVDWLMDQERFKGMVKGRRIGGSFAVAQESAGRAAGFDWVTGDYAPGTGEDEYLISASQYQAEDLLQETLGHLRGLERLINAYEPLAELAIAEGVDPAPEILLEMASVYEQAGGRLGDGGDQPGLKQLGRLLTKRGGSRRIIADVRSDQIMLTNGNRIRARPANPDTVRGVRGNLTFDEFGSMPQSREIWAAALPIINRTLGDPKGFCLRVIGTPLGDDNMFFRLANTEEGSEFSWHWVDLYRALHDGFPCQPGLTALQTVQKLRREAGDEEIFLQEYCCRFLSASSRYIQEGLLEPPISYDPNDPEVCKLLEAAHEGGQVTAYGGHDVARSEKGDNSATVVVWQIGDIFWVRPDIWAERGASFLVQKDKIGSEIRENGVVRLCLDQTGMGENMAEDLHRKYGRKVEPVRFNEGVKVDLATRLKRLLEEKRLRLPTSESQLRRDLLGLRRTITAGGSTRFDILRSRGTGHGDRAWALMLALLAADGDPTPRSEKKWRKPKPGFSVARPGMASGGGLPPSLRGMIQRAIPIGPMKIAA